MWDIVNYSRFRFGSSFHLNQTLLYMSSCNTAATSAPRLGLFLSRYVVNPPDERWACSTAPLDQISGSGPTEPQETSTITSLSEHGNVLWEPSLWLHYSRKEKKTLAGGASRAEAVLLQRHGATALMSSMQLCSQRVLSLIELVQGRSWKHKLLQGWTSWPTHNSAASVHSLYVQAVSHY